ncbi:Alpha/beta hydrolase family-domain-containing protein [Flagelloscypha sp. PMI_526]|nr:Alpha/beta hydrolase family-domain-containing protein [Flagelloscypha sp. PMI_526]
MDSFPFSPSADLPLPSSSHGRSPYRKLINKQIDTILHLNLPFPAMSIQEDQWQGHYSRPTVWEPQEALNPRPLLPIYPPPDTLITPAPILPSRATSEDLASFAKLGFRHSSHIVPACFLRSSPPHPLPAQSEPQGLSREERSKYNDDLFEMVLNLRIGHNETLIQYQPGQPSQGHRQVMWNCVDRFVRIGEGKGKVTLLLLHAIGFSKEIWETCLGFLLQSPEVRSQVGEIWSFEGVQHGDSAIINGKTLESAGLSCWEDHSRDIVHFLTHFLPSQSSDLDLPAALSPIPLSETQDRLVNGLAKNRRLVTIGHSFGSSTALLAAIHFPRLFSSLFLMDPIVIRPRMPDVYSLIGIVMKTGLMRKNLWSCREEAIRQLSRSPFFESWHHAALQSYLNHGLHVATDGKTRLKMPPLQECIMFSDVEAVYSIWHQLPSLDKDITLRYVLPCQPSLYVNSIFAVSTSVHYMHYLFSGLDDVISQELV